MGCGLDRHQGCGGFLAGCLLPRGCGEKVKGAKGAEGRLAQQGQILPLSWFPSRTSQGRKRPGETSLQHFREAWSVSGRLSFPMVWDRIPQRALCIVILSEERLSLLSSSLSHMALLLSLKRDHFISIFPSPLKTEHFKECKKPKAENMVHWLGDQLTRPDLVWLCLLQFSLHHLTSLHANEIRPRTSPKGLFLPMKTMTLQETR